MSYKDKKKSIIFDSVEGYNLYAKNYDKKTDYLNSFENDVVLKFLGNLKGKKVLDIGCGTGRIIKNLMEAGAKVVAADVSEEMLKVTKKKFKDAEIVCADIENLPFKDKSFDCVLALFVVVHLRDLQKAFDEVYRVLKDGGTFIVSNINQRKPPKLNLKDGGEIIISSYYHMPEHVEKALENSFFQIDRAEFVYENNVWINQVIKVIKKP